MFQSMRVKHNLKPPTSTIKIKVKRKKIPLEAGWKIERNVIKPIGELKLKLVPTLIYERIPTVKLKSKRYKEVILLPRHSENDTLLGLLHAQTLLKYQNNIPSSWKEYILLFPGTILLYYNGIWWIPSLSYLYNEGWCLSYHLMGHEKYYPELWNSKKREFVQRKPESVITYPLRFIVQPF